MMSSPAVRIDPVDQSGDPDELPVGTRLLQDQFTISAVLSAGGFGITYVARDLLGREVAIKECFPASFCRRSGQQVAARTHAGQQDLRSLVTLFRQEAINLARLNHQNIVRVHQVFEDNDTAYMVMDYIRGPDLLHLIEGTLPPPAPDRIAHLLQRMLDALGHVHAQGLLHRDIAPDNILIDSATGEPVLIDFGAARKDEARESRMLAGLRVVKDGYSPQELYIGGSKQAPCSDLYALAATFSHLITGKAPKTARDRLSAVANRQRDPQQPLLGRVDGYPDGFLAAIDKAMSIFPRDRLQSVVDWRAMLASGDQGSAAVHQGSPLPRPAPVGMPPQTLPNRDWLVRTAAISVLIAGLVSVAGDLYDRFWPAARDSMLDRDALAPDLPQTGSSPVQSAALVSGPAGHPGIPGSENDMFSNSLVDFSSASDAASPVVGLTPCGAFAATASGHGLCWSDPGVRVIPALSQSLVKITMTRGPHDCCNLQYWRST